MKAQNYQTEAAPVQAGGKWQVIHIQKGQGAVIVGGHKHTTLQKHEYRLLDETGSWLATGSFGVLAAAVRDHNSHAALVEAVEAFLFEADQHAIGAIPSGIHEAAKHAHAALALVKGGGK